MERDQPLLGNVSRTELTRVIRQALQNPMAEVVDWQSSILGGGYSGSSVSRLSGTARQDGRLVPWSLILKALRPAGRSEDPANWRYWRREVEVWKSGLLDALPPSLAAPLHYSAVEEPGEARLWLEDFPSPSGRDWPVERLALAARHVGAWQGGYLVGRPLPDYPWLTRRMLHQWVAAFQPAMATLARAGDDPAVRRYWPGAVYDRVLALSADAPRLLEAVDRMPLVFGHGDFQPNNLFLRDESTGPEVTAVIDWAITGLAPIGREITHLIALSALQIGSEPSWVRSFEETVYRSYVQGLRDAGWRGDERIVRLAHAISLGLSGGLHPLGLKPLDEAQRAEIEHAWGLPAAEIVERNAWIRAFCLDLADEARELLSSISLGRG